MTAAGVASAVAGSDPDKSTCPRWCDYRDGGVHPRAHMRHAADVPTTLYPHGRIVMLTVESADDDGLDPVAVLTIAAESRSIVARLTWPEISRFARQVLTAADRHDEAWKVE